MNGKILIFYKYTQLACPEDIKKWQLNLCIEHNLTGRILIGQEGINGTVGGSSQECLAYAKAMTMHPLFKDIDIKESPGGAQCFPKLSIKIRNEIVTLGINSHTFTPHDSGIHLTPKKAHELMQKAPHNLLVFDIRNLYESRIGTFKNALRAEIENFRELPHYIDTHLEEFYNKDVLMVCTAGIRCERATTYLKKKNIAKNVYQLKGGIHRYTERYPKGFFKGKNYVFDGRIAVKVSNDIITNCDICNIQCDDYTNCINVLCNKQFIACSTCIEKFNNACNTQCMVLINEKKVKKRTKEARINAT